MPHIPSRWQTPPVLQRAQKALGTGYDGKVRRMWDLGSYLLMVATNRISAFDYVLGDDIDQKGAVLTAMTINWPRVLGVNMPVHHLVAWGAGIDEYLPAELRGDAELQKIGVVVRKYQPIMIECIGRWVLTGSGYKDYLKTGEVNGVKLPPGLPDGYLMDNIRFTPSTKAEVGHDVNISTEQAEKVAGKDVVACCGEYTVELLRRANLYTMPLGIRVADTKFEFGLDPATGEIVLIDEILTPDSSRFMVEEHRLEAIDAGVTPPSLDKQYVRDYLERVGFKKMTQPERDAYHLPTEIKQKTTQIYVGTAEKMLGMDLDSFHSSIGIA